MVNACPWSTSKGIRGPVGKQNEMGEAEPGSRWEAGWDKLKGHHSLCRILAQAYRYNEMVLRNDGKTIAELAAEAGVGGSYLSRILRLSFLAPDVVKAILRDRHPIELTAKRLAYRTRLPIAWDEQRALLGID